MSLTKPIPKELNHEMNTDVFYRTCCLKDNECKGRIERHHNFMFGSTGRVNEKWCLLPLCTYHHSIEKRSDVKEMLDFIMWNRAGSEADKYAKFSHIAQRINYLNGKYNHN